MLFCLLTILCRRRPPPLPDGYLKWIFALLKIPDDQIIKSIGLDRFMVLKLLRMGIITFAIYSLVAIPILFPVITINQGNLSGLNYLTMGNITDSNRTWANCLLAILLSGKKKKRRIVNISTHLDQVLFGITHFVKHAFISH